MMRRQVLIGEILLAGAFVYLHSFVSARLLYPATIIAASALVAFRRVMGNAIEAMEAELQRHQAHQVESRATGNTISERQEVAPGGGIRW